MRSPEKIKSLFKKYLVNQSTEEEETVIFELLRSEEYKSFFKELIGLELAEQVQEKIKNSAEVKAALSDAKNNIIQRLNYTGSKKNQFTEKRWFRFAAAAVIVCCTGLAVFFYANRQAQNTLADIGPGGNKAVLTLANGSKIILDKSANGNLSDQAGIRVNKTEDGKLVYTVSETGTQGENPEGDVLTNTISTPRGGQYQVNLPDGTSVWLNAESVLKFPLSFTKSKGRIVELRGEAYFEVAKVTRKIGKKEERIPFFVKTENQEIEVLGTHFNVNAYANNEEIKTTLLEGAVRVKPVNGTIADQKVLKPGQQSLLSGLAKKIKVIEIDPLTEIAWKNGQFFFENEPIKDIMKEIGRWYDVEVVYQADVSEKTVWGSVTRYANVSKVLSILELTGEIHFKVEGRRITVQK